jgi:hypothetical protein
VYRLVALSLACCLAPPAPAAGEPAPKPPNKAPAPTNLVEVRGTVHERVVPIPFGARFGSGEPWLRGWERQQGWPPAQPAPRTFVLRGKGGAELELAVPADIHPLFAKQVGKEVTLRGKIDDCLLRVTHINGLAVE